jgi:hypothetical protein
MNMLGAALVLAAVIAQSAPPPRDPRALAITAAATLSGRVVDDRDAPVPGATVIAVGGPSVPGARAATTTEDGRYAIAGIEPGLYTLAAAKAGYPTIAYDAARPGAAGRPFEIKAGQLIVVPLRMPRGAVITGTLVNDRGEPNGASVVVTRESAVPSRQNRARTYVSSNAHAEFRVFGLAAGTYKLTTASAEWRDGDTEPPGTITLTVAPGEERGGVVLRVLPPRPTTYVTVAASASDGQPLPYLQVSLRRPGELRPVFTSSRPNPDGSKTLTEIPAGQYRAIAHSGAYWGSAEVAVDGEHPASVSMSLTRGVYVRGRATFEGGPPPGARSSPSLALGPADADALIDDNGGIFAPIAADGSFTLTGVPPGRYVMHAMTSSSDGWRLASAKVGELDIADVPLAVDREDVGGVAVIMTMSRSLLRGRVTWKTGDPANGVDVIAFPTEEKYRVRDSRRVATAHTTIAGEYEIAGLPPGTYGIAVADDVDVQALKDPGVVRRLRAISTVTLAAGETRVHDVTVR